MNLSPKAQASLNQVIQKFQEGDWKQITQIAKIQLDPSMPASQWSFSNRIIAYAQAGELDCRGFRQWQAAQRQVKKGSRAAFILSPRVVKEIHEEGRQEKEVTQVVGFSTIPVFKSGDTQGEGELLEYSPVEFPPLYEVAQRLGIAVKYLPTPDDRLGDCNAVGTVIRLGAYSPAVFFHELAHAVHARIEGPLSKGKRARQETIAEFTAAVLMEMYGYSDHTGNAWHYIKKFAPDPLLAITSAMKTVEEILKVITNEAEGEASEK
jgi:hypothetical protein